MYSVPDKRWVSGQWPDKDKDPTDDIKVLSFKYNEKISM